MEYTLDCLPVNLPAHIIHTNTNSEICRRLLDLGLIEGTEIETVLIGPGGNPRAYCFRGAVIALRNEDARQILVCAEPMTDRENKITAQRHRRRKHEKTVP